MPQILFALQSAFSLWMLVDAVQRRRESYWYFVVLLPFGEVVYFFMVKIHDPEMRWLKQALRFGPKPPTVAELRYRLRSTPCQANLIALAQGLHDAGEDGEAAELFAQALARDPESKAALLGSGSSLHHLGRSDEAEAALRRLIELDPAFADYQAWAELAKVLWARSEVDACLGLLRDLVARSPRMAHRVVYADYLIQAGDRDAARDQLTTALDDHRHGPRYLRRVNGGWARQARAMLNKLPAV